MMKIRVYYEDTDTGGIVYHSNYINFCERARSEIFFERGLSPHLASGSFVVKKLIANFVKPARLGDMLEVKSSLKLIKAASFTLNQTIYKDGVKLFELEIVLAYVSFKGKVQKIDVKTKELLLTLFSGCDTSQI